MKRPRLMRPPAVATAKTHGKPRPSAMTPATRGAAKNTGAISVVPRPIYVGRSSAPGANSSMTFNPDTLTAAI
jgi:hypothetical protein